MTLQNARTSQGAPPLDSPTVPLGWLPAPPGAPRLRTVAVVGRSPEQHVMGAVLGAVDHDVVLVEPTDCAYSHIKRIRPDLVIVCMSADDVDGCRVLSMLILDRETSSIPVLTHVTSIADGCATSSDIDCEEADPTAAWARN